VCYVHLNCIELWQLIIARFVYSNFPSLVLVMCCWCLDMYFYIHCGP